MENETAMRVCTEIYHEYYASCSKCHRDVLEIIEYMDIQKWDSDCGVCPKCKEVFCGKCLLEKKNKTVCPICHNEVLLFYDAYVYDLISVLEHDCQPFAPIKKAIQPLPNGQRKLLELEQKP